MRRFWILVPLGLLVLLAACSQPERPVATAYGEPPEMRLAYDSLNIYSRSIGRQGNFEEYRAIFDHFLQLYPNSTNLHRGILQLFDRFGKSNEKTELYRGLQEENPESPMYAYLYGLTLDRDQAEKYFRLAIELDPDYPWGHHGLASSHLTAQNPDTTAAIAAYLDGCRADPSFPFSYRELGDIYKARGQYEDALWAAESFAATQPGSFTAVGLKLQILETMGDSSEIETTLKEFVETNPEEMRAKVQLMQLYTQTDRQRESLIYLHQLVDLSPDTARGQFELAKAYAKLEETDSALSYLNNAVAAGFSSLQLLETGGEFALLEEDELYQDLKEQIQENARVAREQLLNQGPQYTGNSKADALANKLERPAPAFSFADLEGKTVSLADYKGKVVVLDFWATWCGPCRMTLPLLQKFLNEKPEGVEVVSINVWERDISKVRPYLKENGYTFRVLMGDRAVTRAYGVTGVPSLYVIDKDGVIRFKHSGYSPNAVQQLKWQTEALL